MEFASSIAEERRSGLNRPDPTWMSDIWTILITCLPSLLHAPREHYASSRNIGQRSTEKRSGLLELLLNGSGRCRAGRLLVRCTALRREKLSGQIGEDRMRGGKFFVRRLFKGYP